MAIKYNISQSLIKKFLRKGDEIPICPKNIYETVIDPEVETPPTEPMLKGSYFETLTLGSGRGGHKTLDLPRKRLTKKQEAENVLREEKGEDAILGGKRLDQIRIEEQAERFKILRAQRQIVISEFNTQVRIYKKWEENPSIFLRGELDIFPTPVLGRDGLQMAIIDIKLTQKIDNDFGDYCWGAPEHMDHIQGQMYHYLIRDVDYSINKDLREIVTQPVKEMIARNDVLFLYWVFSYGSGDLRDKFVRYDWDKNKEAEFKQSVRRTISIIEDNEAKGWLAEPEYERCNKCPISDCAERCEIQAL